MSGFRNSRGDAAERKMELLGTAPVPRALVTLGFPIMIGMMINAFYNLADAYFVAGLGERAMGAISVVFPLGQVIVGLGLMFGNGAASCVSRLLGREDWELADKTASTALFGSVFAGTAVIVFISVFLTPILLFLGATDTILPYAEAYGRIYILTSIFNVFNVTMNNLATSEGAAKTAMSALLLGAVLNLGLDPVFIYGFHMGVTGAAAATAISQAASFSVYLFYILKGKSVFTFSLKNYAPTKQMMGEILKIGVPTLVFQILTSLSITLINRRAMEFGDGVIAAMGAVSRVTSMGTLVVFGFLKGFQPIAGFSYGAGRYDRLREAIRVSVLWSTLFCAATGLAMMVFSVRIVSQFAEGNGEIIATGSRSLWANGLSFMAFGFHTVYSCLFLALGRGRQGLFLGACRQGICFIPVILILPALWGLDGILYAQPIADGITAVVTVVMAWRVRKEMKLIMGN